MADLYRGSTTWATSGSSAGPASLTASNTNRQSGDLLIVVTNQDSTTRYFSTAGTTGWTCRRGTLDTSGGGIQSGNHAAWLFTRVADGTSSDNFTSSLSGATNWEAVMVAVNGLYDTDGTPHVDHGTNPLDGGTTTTEATHAVSVTTGFDNCTVVFSCGIDSASAQSFSSWSVGTERADFGETTGSTYLGIATYDSGSAGTKTCTVTPSSTEWGIGFAISVKPSTTTKNGTGSTTAVAVSAAAGGGVRRGSSSVTAVGVSTAAGSKSGVGYGTGNIVAVAVGAAGGSRVSRRTGSTTGVVVGTATGKRIRSQYVAAFIDDSHCSSGHHTYNDAVRTVVDGINPDALWVGGDVGDAVTSDYTASDYGYEDTWGTYLDDVTYAVPGNHDYLTDMPAAFDSCFNGTPGYSIRQSGKRYFAYDVEVGATTWRIYGLDVGGDEASGSGSAQYTWLSGDLASHTGQPIVAFFHKPRWSARDTSGYRTADMAGDVGDIYSLLYTYHADLILGGHLHQYERWPKMDASGVRDGNGIREIVGGTTAQPGQVYGEAACPGYPSATVTPEYYNANATENNIIGYVKITLKTDRYDWAYYVCPTTGGSTLTDSGTSYTNLAINAGAGGATAVAIATATGGKAAAGNTYQGSGSGVAVAVAAATGSRVRLGAGSQTAVAVATATGTRTRFGSAAVTVVAVSAGAGIRYRRGTAEATAVAVSSAAGQRTRRGSAAAEAVVTGTASALKIPVITVTAPWTDAQIAYGGNATISWTTSSPVSVGTFKVYVEAHGTYVTYFLKDVPADGGSNYSTDGTFNVPPGRNRMKVVLV